MAGLGESRDIQVADSAAADTIGGLAAVALRDAPPRFALAGLSMGGYVAFEMLRREPSRVERLCLVDTTARPDMPEQSQRRRSLMGIAAAKGMHEVVPLLLPGLLSPENVNDPCLVDLIGQMADQVGVEGFVRQQRAILGRPDSRPGLGQIGVPTTVVVGADDQLTPPDRAQEMVDAIRGALLVVIPGAGHLAPIENPTAVTAAMREWLR